MSIDLKTKDVISLISQMSLQEIEKVKDSLVHLSKKYEKAKKLFENDPFYPSLKTELLEPKDRLIYSFRLDKKYRVIFFYIGENEIEIVAFTKNFWG